MLASLSWHSTIAHSANLSRPAPASRDQGHRSHVCHVCNVSSADMATRGRVLLGLVLVLVLVLAVAVEPSSGRPVCTCPCPVPVRLVAGLATARPAATTTFTPAAAAPQHRATRAGGQFYPAPANTLTQPILSTQMRVLA